MEEPTQVDQSHLDRPVGDEEPRDSVRRHSVRRHYAFDVRPPKRPHEDDKDSGANRILGSDHDIESGMRTQQGARDAGQELQGVDAVATTSAKRVKVTKPDTTGSAVVIFPSLPLGAEDDNRWKGVFVPTLLKFLGSREDPFFWKDDFAVTTLQQIWNVVYASRIAWTVRRGDLVHASASRVIQEWRETIRKTGVLAFDAFFRKAILDFPTSGRRQHYCSGIMDEGRLFYAAPDEMQGLYRSPFVLGPLHAHLRMIKGAADVPTILSSTGYDHPYAAIGLAAAAAYYAAALWRFGKVSYDKHGTPIIVKAICHRTAKETLEEIAFRSIDFRRTAMQCTASACKLGPNKLYDIVLTACEEGALPELQSLPSVRHEVVDDDFTFLIDRE